MFQQEYFVPKATGTLSDTLIAFGAVEVISRFVRQRAPATTVMIKDAGAYFVVDTGTPIQEAWLDEIEWSEDIPFVTSSKFVVPDDLALSRARNVDDTWDRFRNYQEQSKQLRDHKVATDEMEQTLADFKMAPDWSVVTYLGDYRMQAQGIHNNLVEQWQRTSKEFAALNMRTLLALFSSPTAKWDDIIKQWKKETKGSGFSDTVTASQLFNPEMGKGQNRVKANKLTMGNEKSFWLLEYLKAVGIWKACAPTKISNADLRKTYVLAPIQLELKYHDKVFEEYRDNLWNESSVKQDIVASLLYTETLLKQSIEDDALDIFDDGPLSNLVSGMNVATYQLLSANSYTTMNLSFLGLPDWMPSISTSEDAENYLAVLTEHRERVRSIGEEKSEGISLLQLYRDFVSGNDLSTFLKFYADYSSYLISAIDRSQFFIRPFTETNLERLIAMSEPKYMPVLQDEGFRNIAYAIRMSTLVPLYLGRKKSRFDVRYGIGQELKRKAQYKDDFVDALAEFMQSYNDETMRVHERTKGSARRRLITTGDIESVIALLDKYDSRTICHLLIAFGYARDPKEKPESDPALAISEDDVNEDDVSN